MRINLAVYLFWLLWVLTEAAALATPTPPAAIPTSVEPDIRSRLFYRQADFTTLVEAGTTAQSDGRQESSVLLGSYYKVARNLKVGAFFRRAYGLRHDGDWNSIAGQWGWADTKGRAEDFLILDATPRAQFSLLGSDAWVAEVKSRFLVNSFDGEQTLLLRPGISYFWLRGDEPFMNFFAQFEVDAPLNYGSRSINERWLYFGALYRVARPLDLGVTAAWKWQTWSSTADFVNRGGTAYALTAQSAVLSFVAIFEWGG